MKSKANLSLIVGAMLLTGLAAVGFVENYVMQRNARDTVSEQARVMMEAAQAIRHYTVKEIRPLLAEQMQSEFLPQTVPAYAATTTFGSLREEYRDFTYREPALNPTNLRNKATDWEAEIIQYFRNNPDVTELSDRRETPTGPALYLAKPIKIGDAGCLTCHSTVADAPRPLLKKYGMEHGFGWQLNEVVAAQVVSVPMTVPVQKAQAAFYLLIAAVGSIFVGIGVVINSLIK